MTATDAPAPRRSRWKTVALVVGGLVAVAVITFALGPRVVVDDGALLPVQPPPESPPALDAWLAEREARVDDLTPDTDKRIFWADPTAPAKTPLSVVYVHGFSATRQETAPVAQDVARALGANLFMTRLRGHGRPGAALGQVSAERWMEDTIEALAIGERIGDRVLLIGCSTGATLAVWLTHWLGTDRATGPAERMPVGLVLLAPNFGAADPAARILTMPWGEALAGLILGDTYTWQPANAGQARFWTWTHPPRALIAMQSLVDHVHRQPADSPDLPTLMIYATHDDVIDTAAAAAWAAARPETRTVVELTDDVPRGNHVLAGSIMAPSRTAGVTAHIVDFTRGLPAGTP